MPPSIFKASAFGVWTTGAGTAQLTTPKIAAVGDLLVAIFAWAGTSGQVIDTVNGAPLVGWRQLAELTSPSSSHIIALVHEVAASDVGVNLFAFSSTGDDGAAAILVYSGLDPDGLLVDGEASEDLVAVASVTSPSLTLATYSDLYLGGSLTGYAAGHTIAPPSGTVERLDSATATQHLELYDWHPEATGATGDRVAAVTGGTVSGVGFALALAAKGAIGPDKAFAFDPPGAYGLPLKGV